MFSPLQAFREEDHKVAAFSEHTHTHKKRLKINKKDTSNNRHKLLETPLHPARGGHNN